MLHPASAGHGLNLQGSSAKYIIFFSLPWDAEQYVQAIGRLRRPGNKTDKVIVYRFIADKTIEERVLKKLDERITQHERRMNNGTASDWPLQTILPEGAETSYYQSEWAAGYGCKGRPPEDCDEGGSEMKLVYIIYEKDGYGGSQVEYMFSKEETAQHFIIDSRFKGNSVYDGKSYHEQKELALNFIETHNVITI